MVQKNTTIKCTLHEMYADNKALHVPFATARARQVHIQWNRDLVDGVVE